MDGSLAQARLMLGALLLSATLTACGGDEARRAELSRELAALDHVDSVTVGASSGELVLDPPVTAVSVSMDPNLAEQDLRAVLVTAYEGIADEPWSDAWIRVDWGGNRLTVQCSGSQDVEQELLTTAEFARSLARARETTESTVDLTGADRNGLTHSRVVLHLAPSSRQTDLVPRVEEIAADQRLPRHTAITVLAADGGGLAGAQGLPTRRDRRTWTALTAARLPVDFTVRFEPLRLPRHGSYTRTTVTLLASPPATDAGLRQRVRLIRRHLAILAAYEESYVYTVAGPPGTRRLTIDSRVCEATAGGWTGFLDTWILAPTGSCPHP